MFSLSVAGTLIGWSALRVWAVLCVWVQGPSLGMGLPAGPGPSLMISFSQAQDDQPVTVEEAL